MLGLGCLACQPQEKVPQAHRPPLSRPAATVQRPAGTPASTLELLAIGDSLGPQPIDVSRVHNSQLTGNPDSRTALWQNIGKHFLFIKGLLDEPLLLYRNKATDTVWTELELLSAYEHGLQQQEVTIREVNLNGQGRPEVLLTYSSADLGSGAGTYYESTYLLDVTPYPPLLLLRARTSATLEAFPAYAAMHGDTLGPGEGESGHQRTMAFRHRELVVSPIVAHGNDPGDNTLTKLPAGHYRYQHGRMYVVKKP